jgi:alpha-tubulin suppressor-like RCC1 family protein
MASSRAIVRALGSSRSFLLAVLAAGCGVNEGSVLDAVCPGATCTEAGAGSDAGGDAGAPPADGGGGEGGVTGAATPSLAASPDATCTTRADGTLWCWGENTDGALLAGSTGDVVPAVRVGTDNDWLQVSGADGHCALKRARTLHCWGPNDAVPGVASAATPTQVEPTIAWAQAIAGGQHHCALAQDQSLYCWGLDSYGQLGLGDTAPRDAATQVSGTWRTASVGLMHTCGVKPDGSLWCWGHGAQGQLGLGDGLDRNAPAQVGTSAAWVAVSAGGNHTCALDVGGAAWCWGENVYGEVGSGGTQVQQAPVRAGSGTYRAVASGGGVTCAVATDGSLWCWGTFGQTAQPGQSLVPVQVDASTDWTGVAAGYSHACGVRSPGGQAAVYCLGWNFAGQLAQPPSATYSASAVEVSLP